MKPVIGQDIPFLFNLVYSNREPILGCMPLPTAKSTLPTLNHYHHNSGLMSSASSNASLSISTNAVFSILRDDSAFFIDKSTSKTTSRLKIRIHDISKNHQRIVSFESHARHHSMPRFV